MRSKIAALVFVILTEVGCAKTAAPEGILLREISYHRPEAISLFYRFPGPIKSATVDLKMRGEFLESAQIKFGNGEITQIPQSVLACFRYPLIQRSFFLAITPDAHVMEKNWEPMLAVPYRPETEPAADDDSPPYVLFSIRDWKLHHVVVHRSPDNDQEIPLPVDKCPAIN